MGSSRELIAMQIVSYNKKAKNNWGEITVCSLKYIVTNTISAKQLKSDQPPEGCKNILHYYPHKFIEWDTLKGQRFYKESWSMLQTLHTLCNKSTNNDSISVYFTCTMHTRHPQSAGSDEDQNLQNIPSRFLLLQIN